MAGLAWVGRLVFVLLASPAGQAMSTRAMGILPANRTSDRLLQTAVTLPVNYYPASSYPNGFTLVQSNLVGVVALPTQYTGSFDLMQTSACSGCQILLLTKSGTMDFRLPEVRTCSSAYGGNCVNNLRFLTGYKPGGGLNEIFSPQDLSLNQWSTITITIDTIKAVMAVSVLGAVTIPTQSSVISVDCQAWPIVQVCASSSSNLPATGMIRNLAILTPAALPVSYYPADSYPSGLTLYQGNLVCVVALPSTYTLSLDLFPTADGTGWRDIIHLTATGGDADGAGSRLPLLSFCASGAVANGVSCPTLGLLLSFIGSGIGRANEVLTETAQALPLNVWSTVTVTIDSGNKLMTLTVTGGVVIPSVIVAFPVPAQQAWPLVQVFASDFWWTTAAAKIRNLAITTSPPILPGASTPVLYTYIGAAQTYVVPEGASKLLVSACGGGVVAKGGYISSVVPVAPGSTLYVYVGGGSGNTFNGGGSGTGGASNGAGGSDIRTAKDDLSSRLVVAGGAGGSAGGNGIVWAGGAGGGLVGGTGSRGSDATAAGGGGGQTSGGAAATYQVNGCQSNPGVFGAGGSCSGHSGGGGGWWGGGAGWDGAGGGSSYTIPTGTILQNVQGDARCLSNGWVALTVFVTAALPVNYYPSSLFASGFTLTQGNLVGVVALPASYALRCRWHTTRRFSPVAIRTIDQLGQPRFMGQQIDWHDSNYGW